MCSTGPDMTALSDSSFDVVCLGILVADTIATGIDLLRTRGSLYGNLALSKEISLHPGGCAINTASWLRRLGLDVAVVGKIGEDAFGDFLLAELDERKIDRRAVLRDPRCATSASVALVDGRGERTFLHARGANGALEAREIDRDVLFAGAALHIGGALAMPALDGRPMADLLAEAQTRHILTSLDIVWDPTDRWALVRECLPHLDLFTANLREATAITGLADLPAIARSLHAGGARNVAIKLGANGSFISGDGFSGHVRAKTVEAVDGTGAGDAFVAGMLFARHRGWSVQDAGRLGNAAGAVATTAVGAEGPQNIDELTALMEVG